jgi:hypothetical protein
MLKAWRKAVENFSHKARLRLPFSFFRSEETFAEMVGRNPTQRNLCCFRKKLKDYEKPAQNYHPTPGRPLLFLPIREQSLARPYLLKPEKSLRVKAHSVSGFNWGDARNK